VWNTTQPWVEKSQRTESFKFKASVRDIQHVVRFQSARGSNPHSPHCSIDDIPGEDFQTIQIPATVLGRVHAITPSQDNVVLSRRIQMLEAEIRKQEEENMKLRSNAF
jgi:hypothetical protein